MTFSQLHFFLKGKRDNDLEQWRIARWMVAYVTAPHVKNPKQPHQILPLENDTVSKPMSAEKYKELKSKWYPND